ncbi:hypothetical protein [Paraflavitalea speifideaquila]|uniref:hypothetical protein n=1 Tax=Paraflavitalea speifideaquila TaxID=3076558 RepID=UPI0028E6135D|nr:hypothetical protein [Paraflavitalea speifideiaquila]
MKFACINQLLSGWRIKTFHTGIYARPVYMLVCFLLLVGPAFAQTGTGKTITVKGVIKDAKGAPLSGVSITEKGGEKATLTFADGSFSLSVPPILRC